MRRLLLVALVSLGVLAIPSAVGSSFELRLISETNNRITLGWDLQQGVSAYVFYANSQRVSHTFDGSRTQVTFAKVQGCTVACYGVEDLRSDGISSYPGTIPPPPDQVPASIAANCSQDVSSALQSWINSRPNGSSLTFPSGSCYLVQSGLSLSGRTGISLLGTGSTLRATTVGDGHRPNLKLVDGGQLTVRGFRLEGGYTTPGTHNTAVQWSHGIEVLGTQTVLIEDVTAINVGGDCVYLGLGASRTRDATVRRLTCTGTGRNGVSFVAADRSRVEQSSTSTVGYIPFDVEPNSGAGFGVDTAVITGNTIGSYAINALTIVGSAPVNGISFTNNQVTAPTGARIQVTGLPRRTNVTISGNTATQTLSYPQAIRLDNVDGATVTNNSLPTTGVMLRCASVTALTFSGNTPNTQADCSTPPPPVNGANLWVDANGGSCTRQATEGPYNDAAACASFAAAYTAALSGDTVGVTGSLPNQFFAGGVGASQGSGTKTLTFKGAAGNKVRQIHFGSPNMIFDGIVVDAGATRTSGAAFENGGDSFLFKNGSIGNVVDEKGALVTETGATFENVLFHDVVLRTNGVHLECMMTLSGERLTIRNSTFRNCAIMDISVGIADWWTPLPPPYGNVTLEGNTFGNSRFDNGGCCATYSVALWSTKIAVGSDFGQLNGWTIRNNYIEPGSDVIVRPTVGTGTVICGNTGNAPTSWKTPC